MFEINHNVVLVKGARNAAIYNFNDSKVYSIDSSAYSIIYKVLIENQVPDNDFENQYIESLKAAGLFSESFEPRNYVTERDYSVNLAFAWLELTNNCNYKCLHCYEGVEHCSYDNELSLQDWKLILQQLYDVGCKKIQFTGGEPCLSLHLKELLFFASNIGFDEITVFTNASLLNDELIGIFHNLNIKVRFSLYGHRCEIHDAVTQRPGSFDKAIANVVKMIALEIDVYPAVIILKENEAYIKEIKSFIESLGLRYRGYDVIRPACYGDQSKHLPTIPAVKFSKYQLHAHFTASKELFDKAFTRNTCWYGKIAIDAIGNVYPCIFQRKTLYGNIKISSIRDILASDELKQGWFADYSKVESCKDCEFRFACKDCRALVIASLDSFFGKNPRCTYNPYLGQWENPLKK